MLVVSVPSFAFKESNCKELQATIQEFKAAKSSFQFEKIKTKLPKLIENCKIKPSGFFDNELIKDAIKIQSWLDNNLVDYLKSKKDLAEAEKEVAAAKKEAAEAENEVAVARSEVEKTSKNLENYFLEEYKKNEELSRTLSIFLNYPFDLITTDDREFIAFKFKRGDFSKNQVYLKIVNLIKNNTKISENDTALSTLPPLLIKNMSACLSFEIFDRKNKITRLDINDVSVCAAIKKEYDLATLLKLYGYEAEK